MIRSLTAAIAFSVLSVLATAQGGLISATATPYSGPVTLGSYYAIWGIEGSDSLVPSPFTAPELTMTSLFQRNPNGLPLRGLGNFDLTEYQFITPQGTLYGGIQHDGQGAGNPALNVGTGFDLVLVPLGVMRTYSLYMMPYLGAGSVDLVVGGSVVQTVSLGSNLPVRLDVTTDVNTGVRAAMTSATGTDSNLSIGAVEVLAVPEPATLALVATGVCFLAVRRRR
jgi:hypothetical protein